MDGGMGEGRWGVLCDSTYAITHIDTYPPHSYSLLNAPHQKLWHFGGKIWPKNRLVNLSQ